MIRIGEVMLSSIFVTLAYPGKPLSRTSLLLSSLRKFGGSWGQSPLWVLHPQSRGSFSEDELARLEDLGAETVPFTTDEGILQFPLGTKVQAAAAAERLAEGKAEQLIWLDGDTLVLSPLDEFTLLPEKVLGYRPVHHKLLGTAWGEPLDQYWELVYRACGASPESDFPMTTHLGEKIRPYFNAGCYAIRPAKGILREWESVFKSHYREPAFRTYYEKDGLYAVFTHQAIFTGVVLANLTEADLQALSPAVNYPLHLHEKIPASLQTDRLDDLVTARYEDLLEKPGWQDDFSLSRELEDWVEVQRAAYFKPGEGS